MVDYRHVPAPEAYRLGYDSGYLDAEHLWLGRWADEMGSPRRRRDAMTTDSPNGPSASEPRTAAGQRLLRLAKPWPGLDRDEPRRLIVAIEAEAEAVLLAERDWWETVARELAQSIGQVLPRADT